MVRVQLSLFVPPPAAAVLEEVRRELDPVQHRLIPAHVTLCREDELAGLGGETLGTRLASFAAKSLEVRVGRAVSFHGHGVMLPAGTRNDAFHALRRHVLAAAAVREHQPHLTLAHPRNERAPGNDLARAHALPPELLLRFEHAHLIEQLDGAPWKVLEVFTLGRRT